MQSLCYKNLLLDLFMLERNVISTNVLSRENFTLLFSSQVVSPELDVCCGGAEGTDGPKYVPGHRRRSSAGAHTPYPPQKQAEEMVAMEGEYSKNYNTLRPIGKGAFGFVRLAQKISDNSMVCKKTFLQRRK